MHTVYKLNVEKGVVEAVRCEKPGFPNKDEHGETMYTNSHFESKEAALVELLKNLEAWVESDKGQLKELAERQLVFRSSIKRTKGLIARIKRKLK